MKIEFEIPDEKVQNFSSDAQTELTTQAERLTIEIVDEASRIENSRRISDTNSEVTQSNVKESATHPRRFFQPKKTLLSKVIQLVAFISTMISGSMLDPTKFTNTSHLIWFIVTLFVSIGTTVYLTFNNEQNG